MVSARFWLMAVAGADNNRIRRRLELGPVCHADKWAIRDKRERDPQQSRRVWNSKGTYSIAR